MNIIFYVCFIFVGSITFSVFLPFIAIGAKKVCEGQKNEKYEECIAILNETTTIYNPVYYANSINIFTLCNVTSSSTSTLIPIMIRYPSKYKGVYNAPNPDKLDNT